jgi:membrane-bound metal-dependent hydrolase YbcI (DUF457 family)
MPNKSTHLKAGAMTGAVAGGLYSYIKQRAQINQGKKHDIDWGELIGYGILGMVLGTAGGALPDLIEPATNPHHRSFFHSVVCGSAVTIGSYQLVQNDFADILKLSSTSVSTGYVSHLVLDAKTPYGLPLM